MLRIPEKQNPSIPDSLAAEGKEGFQTNQLGARLERYGKAKANALQFSEYLDQQGEKKLCEDLRGCGNYAVFRDYYTVRQTRLSKFCTCKKHLLCPLCAIRRGAKALRVYLAKVAELQARYEGLKLFMVTKTIKNGPDLDERYRHLHNSQRSYHRQRKEASYGRREPVEANKAIAAVWSYEVTNRGKGFHPHSHEVWLCFDAPDPSRLSQEWLAVTGDSMIVDVRPITVDSDGSYVSGFIEVFKYAVKFSDLSDENRLLCYRVLKGKRLQDSFGALRGLDVEPAESDDFLDDLPFIERLYVYRGSRGYVETETKHFAPCEIQPATALENQIMHLVELGWSDDKIIEFLRDVKERIAA